MFGSWVTGLEESGVAPTSAINRDEVLPPVEAEQFELGVRHAITPGLTFIGALFDVSKPTNGFRADGSFGLVGEVRHRGVEGSIAGQLDARTNVVLGAVAFEPEVTGPLVDAGVVGSRAAGISHRIVNANIERRLGDSWSVDAGLSYSGERWADTANTFKTPAVTTLSLGARRSFVLAGRPAEFRVLASNLTGAEGYWATPTGLLSADRASHGEGHADPYIQAAGCSISGPGTGRGREGAPHSPRRRQMQTSTVRVGMFPGAVSQRPNSATMRERYAPRARVMGAYRHGVVG